MSCTSLAQPYGSTCLSILWNPIVWNPPLPAEPSSGLVEWYDSHAILQIYRH
jgi:hypothetical protein